VVRFTGLQTETATKEILLTSRVVKRKIASGNGLDSQAQVEDLRLKYCILKGNTKNRKEVSGLEGKFARHSDFEDYKSTRSIVGRANEYRLKSSDCEMPG